MAGLFPRRQARDQQGAARRRRRRANPRHSLRPAIESLEPRALLAVLAGDGSSIVASSLGGEANRVDFGTGYDDIVSPPAALVGHAVASMPVRVIGSVDYDTLDLADFSLMRGDTPVLWTPGDAAEPSLEFSAVTGSATIANIGHLTAELGTYVIQFNGDATTPDGSPLPAASFSWVHTEPVTYASGPEGWAFLLDPQAGNTLYVSDHVTDASGTTHVIGSFTGQADFDPRPDVEVILDAADGGSFIASFNSNGILVNAWQLEADVTAIAAADGRLAVVGTIEGEDVDLDPRPDEDTNLGEFGGQAGFVLTFDAASAAPSMIQLFPVSGVEGGGSPSLYLGNLVLGDQGETFVTGMIFGGTVGFTQDVSLATLPEQGDDFVARVDGGPDGIAWASRLEGDSLFGNLIGGAAFVAANNSIAIGVSASGTLGMLPDDVDTPPEALFVIGLDATTGSYRWHGTVAEGSPTYDPITVVATPDGRIHAAGHAWVGDWETGGPVAHVLSIDSFSGEPVGPNRPVAELLEAAGDVYVAGLVPRSDNSILLAAMALGSAGETSTLHLVDLPAWVEGDAAPVSVQSIEAAEFPYALSLSPNGQLVFTAGTVNSARFPIGEDGSPEMLVSGYDSDSVFYVVPTVWSIADPFAAADVVAPPAATRPTLDTTKSPSFEVLGYGEPTPGSTTGSILVSTLIAADGPLANFSSESGGLPGIAVTKTNLQGGRLWFTTDAGATWREFGAVSDTSATLLAADASTRLFFAPAPGQMTGLDDVITIRAWDGTGGYANGSTGVNTQYAEPLVGAYNTTGLASSVTISPDGQRAYVTDGADGFQILDITNPEAPTRLGGFVTTGLALDLALSGDGKTAFVATGSAGLQIFDVTIPANPTRRGWLDTAGSASRIALSDDRGLVFVADGEGGLQIVNVTTPAQPRHVGSYTVAGASVMSVELSTDGNRAYVALSGGSAGLAILNVADPTNPLVISEIKTTTSGPAQSWARDLSVSSDDRHVVVSDSVDGLLVIDTIEPATPIIVGRLARTSGNTRISADDRKVYVAKGDVVKVVDISLPAAPVLIKELSTGSNNASSVTLSADEQLAFVADTYAGLLVVDTSRGMDPGSVSRTIAFTPSYVLAEDVVITSDGRHAFVAVGNNLQVVNIADASTMSVIGSLDTQYQAYSVTLTSDGVHAYVGNFGGFVIADVSDPSNPEWISRTNTSLVYDVAIAEDRNLAFAATIDGLKIFSVQEPTAPVSIGSLNMDAGATAVALSADSQLAFVANRWFGLRIIDVSNPGQPIQVGRFDTWGTAEDVALSADGRYAYVADGDRGVQVIDISTPSSPRLVAGYDTDGISTAIETSVDERMLFVADGRGGLLVLDITDPNSPRRATGVDTSSYAMGVALSLDGRQAFIAGGLDGFQAISVPLGLKSFSLETDAVATVSSLPPGQVGDAYIFFDVVTGEFRLNPGTSVPGSDGVNSFGIEMDPEIGLLSTDLDDYFFPSGEWLLFYPQTGANPGNAFGSGFQTWSLPNVSESGDSLSSTNLVIGSPWVVQTGDQSPNTGDPIPGTTAVYASTVPGYVGSPEFSFGFVGPQGLSEADALAALGADRQGSFATGRQVYSLENVVGIQQFRIYVGWQPFTKGAAGTVAENAELESVIYATATTDATGRIVNPLVRYSLKPGVGDESLVEIDTETGDVRLLEAADFETRSSYEFTVIASYTGEDGPRTQELAITVTVNDVNESPSAVRLENDTLSLPEDTDTTARVKLADILVTDDALGTNELSLSGADAARFEIDANGLYLRAGIALDYETKSSFEVIIEAADPSLPGAAAAQVAYRLAITDAAEAATISLPPDFDGIVVEDFDVDGSGFLAIHGTFGISDPDAGEAAFRTSVSPLGSPAGSLSVAATGEFTYRVANSIDAVQALRDGQTRSEIFTITSLDGTTRRVVFTIIGTEDRLAGIVADGYLAGATVFADVNSNRVLDEDELFTTTDESGNFSYDFGSLTATLVSLGGIDISTGLPFVGSLTAPAGSTVINPLTTIVTATVEEALAGAPASDSAILATAVAAATTQVTTGLGLPDVALTSFDPLASPVDEEAAATALVVQKAAASVANVIVVAQKAGIDSAAVVRNISSAVVQAAAPVSLGSSVVLNDLLTITPAEGGDPVPPPANVVDAVAQTNTDIIEAESIDSLAQLQRLVQSATAFVAENADPATIVYVATVTDEMTDPSFSLKAVDGDDAGLVQLDSATGAVRLVQSANYEAKKSYVFTVLTTANDGSLVIEQPVTIGVTDLNDNAPVFTSGATALVMENAAANTDVYFPTATDGDGTSANRGIIFSIDPESGDANLVAMDPATGAVRLLDPTDYEARSTYTFTVVATNAGAGGTQVTRQSVTVTVADFNDNPPVFTSGATGGVAENDPANTVVYHAVSSDADGTADNRSVVYSIRPDSVDAEYLTINPATGEVRLVASADYETKSTYSFTVVAVNTAPEAVLTTEQQVTVVVGDRNDHAPAFSSGSTGTVEENANPDTVVYMAATTDLDGSIANRHVVYSIEPGVGDANSVTIDFLTGAVRLTAAADRETKSSYTFNVIATNEGVDVTRTASQTVTVSVIDLNDNPPMFGGTASGTVTENASSDTVIYTAVTTDGDATEENRGVVYSIATGDDSDLVTIDLNSGEVRLASSADYEEKSSYTFTVVATNHTVDAMQGAELTVTVAVTDSNDNTPRFTSGSGGTIEETSVRGTVVYTAATEDSDGTEANKVVSYSLTADEGIAELLEINPSTGVVTLTADADYNATPRYVFTVVATNAGTDATLTAYQEVTVEVADLNDHAPVFTSGITGSVAENADTGTVIYTAVTTDDDGTPANTAVVYSLKPGIGDAASAAIDPASGEIRLLAPADFEMQQSYSFTVVATNVGVGGTLVTEHDITISVIDRNDNAPMFTSGLTATIMENASVEIPIYTATAVDADGTVANRAVAYTIDQGFGDWNSLTIDGLSGEVRLVTAADYETKSTYTFTVVATNVLGDVTLATQRTVTVTVGDLNDNGPVFTGGAAGSITENAPDSTVIYTAFTTDADGTPANTAVTYSIKADVDDAGLVSIHPTTGEVRLLTSADFEDKASYAFTVVATNTTDDATLVAERAVTVTVDDLNDHAPVFTSAETGSFAENLSLGTVVYTAGTTDADGTETNRDVLYSLKPDFGDEAGMAIDPVTGQVTLSHIPDFETKPTYDFVVVATNNGAGATLTSELSVALSVIDLNDWWPAFESGTSGMIAENSTADTVIYTAATTDADGTEANRAVSYSIAAFYDASSVKIDPTSGVVHLLAPADYETKAAYRFVVVATNEGTDVIKVSVQSVTIDVADVNDHAPVFTSGGTGTVAENATADTVIYTATTTDADGTSANTAVVYSLKPGIGDAASAAINAETGDVTLLASADYEFKQSYRFIVVATNAGVGGTLVTEQDITIDVVDLNDNAPVFTGEASGNVVENASVDTVIYTATTIDADATEANRGVVYSIAAGGDSLLVTVDPSTGAVRLTAPADYETKNSYAFTVVATNHTIDAMQVSERAVTVAVADLDDNPPEFTSGSTATVDENASADTVIYTATTTDADGTLANRAVSYAIKPDVGDADLVTIDTASGQVRLNASADYELKNSYHFTVVATSVAGGAAFSAELAVTVSVNDLNDHVPLFSSGFFGTVAENANATTVIYTATTTDADGTAPNRAVTYSIKEGVDDADQVTIDTSTGEVRLINPADFEAKSHYWFTVVASNSGAGGSFVAEYAVTVLVTDQNDNSPELTSGLSGTVVENSPVDTVVYNATTSDADGTEANQEVEYSIKPGVGDADLVVIDAASGQVRLVEPADFETKATYQFTLIATNRGVGSTLSTEHEITVTVTDVDEPIVVPADVVVSDDRVRSGGYELIKQGPGTLILDRVNSHSGGTVVEAGEVVVRNVAALGSGRLVIHAGATVTLDVGVASISLASLDLHDSGTLDLGFGSVVLGDGTYDLSQVRSLIATGRNGGTWEGTGITSSAARDGSGRAVGYLESTGGDLRIGFAAVGDANMDGEVSIYDLVALNASGKYGRADTVASWADGDFDYDGRLTSFDLVAMNTAGLYRRGSYLPAPPAPVGMGGLAASAFVQASVSASGSASVGFVDSIDASRSSSDPVQQPDEAPEPASSDRNSAVIDRLTWAAIGEQTTESTNSSKLNRWRLLGA